MIPFIQRFIILVCVCVPATQIVLAHHVLGRPSYSLSADSNTPPSMQVETQIGDYFVTYMVFPAFPRANEAGRVNLYVSHIDKGTTFNGEVTFKIRNDSWFTRNEEILGTQLIDDNVYRQGFVFQKDGNYIVTAEFESEGVPYIIDFPLRIGEPFPIGPIGLVVVLIAGVLIGVNIAQRRRRLRMKTARQVASRGSRPGGDR